MTTSSDSRTPSAPRPDGSHWEELRQALPATVQQLDQWIDHQLLVLEERQADFVTRRTRLKGLRRDRPAK